MFDKLFQASLSNYSVTRSLQHFLFPARADQPYFVTQADWKPEAPERFPDILDLIKSVDVLTIDQPKKQGHYISTEYVYNLSSCIFFLMDFIDITVQDPKSSQASSKTSVNATQKPVAYRPPQVGAYRPPQVKEAAAVQAEVIVLPINMIII